MKDINEIADLEQACFPKSEAASAEVFRRRLSVFPDYFWLLEEDGRVVSLVNGLVTDHMHLTDEMYENAEMHNEKGAWQMLFGVATLPEYQRRGYAEMLLRRVISDAGDQGRKGLVLTCKDRLVPYYAKFSFVDEGMSDSEHGGVRWHEMRLIL